MVRLRSAPATQRSPLKEKTNTTRGARKAPVYENDGNTEDLVKARKGRPRRYAKAQNEDEFVMAGGLGMGSDAPPTTDELARSEGSLMTITKPGREAAKTAQKKSLEESVHIGRPSGLSLEASPPSSEKLTSIGKRASLAQPGSALRSHGTPAVETSILALKNFKRRPRQPSMLAMVQQRTAIVSTRPSLAPTAADDDPSVYDFAHAPSDDDDNVFAPEAEGTPVQARRFAQKPARKQTPRAASAQTRTSGQQRKRKSGETDSSAGSPISSQPKRQRTSLDAAPAIPQDLPNRRYSSDRRTTPVPQAAADVQVVNSSHPHPSSTPPTEQSSPDRYRTIVADGEGFAVPSTEEQQQRPVEQDEQLTDNSPDCTMAEPVSSSSVAQSPAHAQQALGDALGSATQAEPLTQICPSPQTRPKHQKARPVSTATLQSLLPRRRQVPRPRHRRSEYDFDAGSDDEEVLDTSRLEAGEDDLGCVQRQVNHARPVTKPRKSAAVITIKAKASKAAQQRSRKSVPEITKKPTRTYGRQATAPTKSDKENAAYESGGDGDDTTDLPVAETSHKAITSAALQAAKDKFAEIDQWDMEFESLGDEDHRSSSQGWR